MWSSRVKPVQVRRWVHHCIACAAVVLLTSGTLITMPDLRSFLIGGRGQVLSDIHMWTGLSFIAVPTVGLLLAGGPVLRNLARRVFSAPNTLWRRLHLGLSLAAGCVLGLSGSTIWVDSLYELPVRFMDGVFLVHLSGAWVTGLALPVHLFMARKAIVRSVRRYGRRMLETMQPQP